MRIVCLSDTHGNVELEVPPGDLLLYTGDHSKAGNRQELERSADWLRSLSHRHKVVLAGNHDFILQQSESFARELFAPMIYLQDQEASVAGFRVYGSPWTPAFGGVWAFQGRDLAPIWEKIPPGLDILLTHGPPANILDRALSGAPAGCASLAAQVCAKRPKLHVFGHIHEAFGVERRGETLYVNASNSSVGYLYPQPVHLLDWDGNSFCEVTSWSAADPLWAYLVERWGAPLDLRLAAPEQLEAAERSGQLFWLQVSAELRFSESMTPGSTVPLSFGIKMRPEWLELLNTNRWSRLPNEPRRLDFF